MQISLLFATIALAFGVAFTNAQTTVDQACLDPLLEVVTCLLDLGAAPTSQTFDAETCAYYQNAIKCYDDVPEDCFAQSAEDKASKESFEKIIADNCGSCLSGDMTVETSSGFKLTKDLSVGDMVSVGSGRFEPVVWNSQHMNGNDNVKAAFVEFSLENGETVTMTPNHFAKTTEGLILAGKVEVNKFMITGNQESVRIQSIQRTMKQGVYNPQTPSQQIEVNGVVASTRSEHSPEFMGLIFQVLAFFHSVVPTTVFSTIITGVSTYVYEPIMFGGNTWALPVATLFFAGAGVKALKA